MPYNAWLYVYADPINLIDPSGYIAEEDAGRADFIVKMLQANYGVHIEKDWGYRLVPIDTSSLLPFLMTGILYGCEWNPGKLDYVELRTIRDAIHDLGNAMKGQFEKFIGPVTIKKAGFSQCGSNFRGCTEAGNRDIVFNSNARPPVNVDISNTFSIDKWSVVHELRHAWDRNYRWSRSELLMAYTHGYIESKPSECGPFDPNDFFGNPKNRLPGCNAAGYFYSGPPPAGSDYGFNQQEDFAESVAAFVYPAEAYAKVEAIINPMKTNDSTLYAQYLKNLYYSDYTKTSRWTFINGLINLGAFQ